MEMRFFWIGDKVAQEMYLVDYQSKHHIGTHHVALRPWYLHTGDSSQYLPQAVRPSSLKGSLPRVPQIQSASLIASATIHRNQAHTGYLPIAQIPMWSDPLGSLTGLGRCIERYIPPFYPVWLM